MPATKAPMTNDGRQDVLLLKQQLAEALGDHGPSYWLALTDFVSGKLNRQEFDFYANLYLDRQHAPLHNQFILANIHNAQKEAPPPSTRSVGWSKGKKNRDGRGDEKDPKTRKVKNQIMSLGKTERERIKALGNKDGGAAKTRLKEPRTPKPPLPVPITQPSQLAEYNRGLHTPLCFDSKELPDFDSLRDRMFAVAMENRLMGGVQEDAVELMLHALESHIKNIISNSIIKLRTNRALGITVPKRDLIQGGSSHSTPWMQSSATMGSTPAEKSSQFLAVPSHNNVMQLSNSSLGSNGNMNKRTTTITARDLAFAIEISPSMLVENPVNVEKLTSVLMEDDSEDEDDLMDDDPDDLMGESLLDM